MSKLSLKPLIDVTSKALRATGQALDELGKKLEVNPYTEKLNPSIRVKPFKGNAPDIKGAFISSSATVMGKVTIGANSSIWYGAIVRGDVNPISIGDKVTVGEGSIIRHADLNKPTPISIGNSVLMGHSVTIDSGVSVGDECCIGDAVLLQTGAKMESKSMITTGSVLPSGSVVKSGEVWGGVPAKKLRAMLPAELEKTAATVAENVLLAGAHAEESAKDWLQIDQDAYDYEQENERSEYYYKRLTAEQLSYKLGEQSGHMYPGRIFDSPLNEEAQKRIG